MATGVDSISVNLPRSVTKDFSSLCDGLNDRMHALLERNTDGALSEIERAELETLVQITQVTQILRLAIQSTESH